MLANDYSWKALIDVEISNSAKTNAELDRVSRSLEKIGKTGKKQLQELVEVNKNLQDSFRKTAEASEDSSKRIARYALYDVADALGNVRDKMFELITATTDVARAFETSFTSVERTVTTTSLITGRLQNQLIELSRQLPVAFGSLAEIASIGGQMDIAAADLSGFTKTVAQFSATTNVSAVDSAKAFGTIGQLMGLTADEYKNLGSAIAFVGVNSVATESDIINVADQIAGVGSTAGLSSEYLVALAGTLASVKIPAEQSRGALTKVFQQVNRAAAENGQGIQDFANVMGVTSVEAKRLADTDMAAFFNQFLAGLSSMNTQELTASLDTLHLSELRVTNTLSKLSGNTALLNKLMGLSSDAYENGGVLAQLYGFKVEDLDSKIVMLQNSWAAFQNTLGAPIADGPLKFLVDQIDNFVNSLNLIAKTDIGRILAMIGAGFLALVGIMATLGTVTAGTAASMFALQTAVERLGWSGASTGIKGLIASLAGLGTMSRGAAAGLLLVRGALISMGVGLAVVAIAALVDMLGKAARTSEDVFNQMSADTSGLASAIGADIVAYREAVASGNDKVADSFIRLTPIVEGASQEYKDYVAKTEAAATVLGTDIPNAMNLANDAIVGNTRYLGENLRAWLKNSFVASDAFKDTASSVATTFEQVGITIDDVIDQVEAGGVDSLPAWFEDVARQAGWSRDQIERFRQTNPQFFAGLRTMGLGVQGFIDQIKIMGITMEDMAAEMPDWMKRAASGVDDLGKAAGGAAAEVRTLVDYANDLRNNMQRAFNIRWEPMLDASATADSWAALADRIDQAKQAVDGLTAERDKLEYFLDIAVRTGDTLRANEIRAELAGVSDELAAANADSSLSLKGNSAAARQNRTALLGIIQSNEDYIQSLAASGVSQKELRRIIGVLEQRFISQAEAMGFASDEVAAFTSNFTDMTAIINMTPVEVTVESNTNPAIQALNEYLAEANASKATTTLDADTTEAEAKLVKLEESWALLQSLSGTTLTLKTNIEAYANMTEFKAAIKAEIDHLLAQFRRNPGSFSMGAANYLGSLQQIMKNLTNAGFASGGYTGAGGKYEPAGVVHKGEYVIPKSLVNQSTGMPYADALGRMMPASAPAARGYANGGFVSGGSMMVSLSPEDRALLRNVGASGDIVVAVDSREIARANANGSRLVTAEGGRL